MGSLGNYLRKYCANSYYYPIIPYFLALPQNCYNFFSRLFFDLWSYFYREYIFGSLNVFTE